MIARSEAIRLARELGVDPARLRDTQGLPPADIAAVDEGSCEKLYQLSVRNINALSNGRTYELAPAVTAGGS